MKPLQPLPPRAHRRQALALGAACALAPSLIAMSNATHALTPTTAPATELPTELRSALPASRLVGTGVLRFFGLRVYEARLWAAPGFVPEDYARHPFALELVYDRKLEGAAIAERSIAEMRRVGSFTEAQARQWLALMQQAFPDVQPQDRLLGLNDGQGEVRFFHNGRQTALLRDADYARLFFGIWLAPQTSAPALRNALLGLG
ncbi:chalcone isomerase family protein [Comamonas terrigena]|uniref:chalcone isomerase family protein n=1 Tax=Comamonas terrigena TaxID=32013 RepID=UPI00244C84D8|nr:chalcone isomerase family protein [Comamonas terrigena]MDH1701689.1 chalcone isomerase family protein [Comamonas terrigena]